MPGSRTRRRGTAASGARTLRVGEVALGGGVGERGDRVLVGRHDTAVGGDGDEVQGAAGGREEEARDAAVGQREPAEQQVGRDVQRRVERIAPPGSSEITTIW